MRGDGKGIKEHAVPSVREQTMCEQRENMKLEN